MNIIKKKSTIKNSRKEEYDIPQHIDLLNKWTILKISPRIIYQMGTFEKLGFKQVGYLSFYACWFSTALRDGRNHNWKKSLIGTIQTSLAYEPIYFNGYPNLQISLQDKNSLSSLLLNVKLHG
ncbi:hypothetical protein H5410_021063 [Solanum commersonii]|uniref:Uncharacterized protein n=1 Tax=Solanum commersonii TaxID=4109 RepID=A0A9J5ZG31_SOLCO|nr:hypothetical protein H5410_021063 [Solanum commersonii]